MRIDINLASQPYQDARQFWMKWGSGLFLLALATLIVFCITALGWRSARQDRQLMRQYEQQIALRDQDRANAEALMNLPQNSTTRDRSQFLNDLFYRKAFSWTGVFEELEQDMPPGLHLVSITPETSLNGDLVIKLTVAGESRERALDLVRKMEVSQRFQQTQIEEEATEVGTTTAGDNVKFRISAIYIPVMGDMVARSAR
jgi:type IV pilus assembly protein PilN